MKKAFALTEFAIVVLIIGIIAGASISTLKPKEFKKEAAIKAGKALYLQIELATKQVLMRDSKNFDFTKLIDSSNAQYSITSSGADAKLIASYKKHLVGRRQANADSAYLASTLTSESGATSLKVSDFANYFTLKNDAFFAIKLNGNCTTSETLIYDPFTPSKRTRSNSCGLILYDINGKNTPNILGVDQYILSIGRLGIK